MRVSALRGAGAAMLLTACLAGAAAAQDGFARLNTNSDLLTRALRAASDSALRPLPVSERHVVVLVPASGQVSEWAVENEIASMLKGRVARLSFHGSLGAAPQKPADDEDATPTAAGPAARPQQQKPAVADERPIDPTAYVLEYRVPVLSIVYERLHRTRLFGPGQVERVAVAELSLRYLDPSGHLQGSGSGGAQVRDAVPQLRLPEVEDRLYQVSRPQLPARNLTRIVEPAIVVGLVAGLVFLFYTNRN